MMLYPESEIEKILTFLNGEDKSKFDSFMLKYDYHKNTSIAGYADKSKSKGEDVFFHSKFMLKNERKLMDEYVRNINPYIYDKYLSWYTE